MFESAEVAAVLGAIPDHELDDVLESILEADLIATGTVEECGLALNRWATRTSDQPPPPEPPEWVLFPPAAIDPTELTGEPGARLADVLSGLLHRAPDLSGSALTDGELVEYVAAAERLSRWAQWMRGTGILALRHRWATTDPTDPTDPTENPASTDAPDPAGTAEAGTAEAGTAEHERARRLADVERRERRHSPLAYGPADSDLAEAFAVSETALAAGVSETMARQWLHIAAALTDRLPICSGALRAGRLDWSKIRAVAEVTDGRTTAITRAAEALVLPDALLPGPGDSRSPGDHRGGPVIRTVPDLKNRLRAALLLLDAAGEADAAARERDTRRVACRAISPSMGELLATLPLDQIALIAARLDHAVIFARRARDPRTADHVRADTLTDLLTRGLIPDDVESSTAAAGADADRPDPDRPDADRPGTAPPSSGPDPSTGTQKRSAHDGSPAGDPLADADPDEARAGATDADPDAATDSDTTEPADFPDPGSPASRGGDSRPQPGPEALSQRPVSTYVLVTITLETLLGLRDDPGYLDRYGPIAADLARDLATRGTWRCAGVDDTHGTLLGLGQATYTPKYTPGRRLTRLQHATYPRCTFPGCRARACHCDLDHADPWPDGPTCSCNTHPLCRRHHRMKTRGHVQLEPSADPCLPPGTWLWRLPTGRTYTSRPEPLLPLAGRMGPAPPEPPGSTAGTRPASDDPPPF